MCDDNQLVAAIAHDWTIGIWDVETSELKQRLYPTPGLTIDNCAIRFSADRSSVYFSAGPEMSQWDLATGHKIQHWPFPNKGLQDRIGINSDGRVLLMRYDRDAIPNDGEPHDGVCRLRVINHNGSFDIIGEWKEFDHRIVTITSTRDGQYFVLDGESVVPGREPQRRIFVVDSTNGQTHSIPLTNFNESVPPPLADEAGYLMQFVQPGESAYLFGLADGSKLRGFPIMCRTLSMDGRLGWVGSADGPWCELFSIGYAKRLVRLQLPSLPSNYESAFSPDAKYVAWANLDGTVSVCDIDRIRQELELIDASW